MNILFFPMYVVYMRKCYLKRVDLEILTDLHIVRTPFPQM
jgi:hypothetical protein